MYKYFSLFVVHLLIVSNCPAQYDHQNIFLLGRFYDSTVVAEPNHGTKYQACYGWTNTITGKEYGIIGSTAGTYIVDVSNPANPVQSDYIPHHQTQCMWHEYKTYGNYLYIISDDVGTGFQIADLSFLPDSVHLLYDSTGLFERAHTISIDNNKMYLGSVSKGPFFSSMNVYSLADPVHPMLLRRLDQDFFQIGVVHDMFVKNDTVYASCGYDGLFIFRYDSVANKFLLLSTLQDNTNIYNHSSALSSDNSTLYVCEELPAGRPVKVVDVSDISTPTLLSSFYSHTGATPHNPEVKGNKLIVAYYMDGVYVYDISNSDSVVQIGYFDTYSANSPGNYPTPSNAGCWSTFSGLPSGHLLASDMQSGLFILDISALIGIDEIDDYSVVVFPNPANNEITIVFSHISHPITIEFFDVTGRFIKSEIVVQERSTISVSDLIPGIYFISQKNISGAPVRIIKQ